jgi:hypothetical protein
MALVSADGNRPAPTGNWVYIKSKFTNFSIDKTEEGNRPVSTVTDRQSWMSLDGLQGWYVEKGSGEDPDGTAVTAPNEPPNVGSPSYRLLSSLPDDPDALLARIRQDTRGQGSGPSSSSTGPTTPSWVVASSRRKTLRTAPRQAPSPTPTPSSNAHSSTP